ncbi:cobalamin binding intrinsic factor-like [Acipenser ruthenus]|uniref:cobalamin binding intrinsic factor-like n=1 Tax=Acipenser ruthenus TaxID=7906 RepID=UPI002740A7D6|nr:cobalamin binding intrinsic factor-like [Acipenser ruthenus]
MAVGCVRVALAVLLQLSVWLPVALQCSVSEIQTGQVIRLLNIMVQSENSSTASGSTPNPSILLALRLASHHDSDTERGMLARLQVDAVKRVQEGLPFSSGTVALYCLAMQASCADPSLTPAPGLKGGKKAMDLRKLLEKKTEGNSKNVPLTNYYQVSLDILALCMMGKPVTSHSVQSLIEASDNGGFSYGEKYSVDTASVAVLALTCVKRSIKAPDRMVLRLKILNALKCLIKNILQETTSDGLIGNLYSTGLAMQALSVTSTNYDCSRTIQTLLERAGSGSFENPMAASQITPSLENRNYLELNKLDCKDFESMRATSWTMASLRPGIVRGFPQYTRDSRYPHNQKSTGRPPTAPEGVITVHYRVEDGIHYSFNDSIEVTVPVGSSLLQVMEEAAKISPAKFRFTVEQSSWGPFVTSIQVLAGNTEERTYWQFLTGSNALDQGVGDYKPYDGDYIVAKFSTN